MKLLRIITYIGLSIYLLILLASKIILPSLFSYSEKEIRERFSSCAAGVSYGTTEINGRKYFYAETGSDTLPGVIFIHGSPGEWKNFLVLMTHPELNGRFHMIACDRAGYSPWDHGQGEKDLDVQTRELYQLKTLNHYKGHDPIFAGHSLGGPIVCRMGMLYHNYTGGIISIAGSLAPDLEPNEWFRPLYKSIPLNLMMSGMLKASNEELYPLRSELRDILPDWEKITCPITIVQGDKDVLVPKENADFARKMITRSQHLEIRMVAGQNHFIPWEQPADIVQAITDMHLLLKKR